MVAVKSMMLNKVTLMSEGSPEASAFLRRLEDDADQKSQGWPPPGGLSQRLVPDALLSQPGVGKTGRGTQDSPGSDNANGFRTI